MYEKNAARCGLFSVWSQHRARRRNAFLTSFDVFLRLEFRRFVIADDYLVPNYHRQKSLSLLLTARSVILRVYTHIYSKKLWLAHHKSAFEFSNAFKHSRKEGDDSLLSENI